MGSFGTQLSLEACLRELDNAKEHPPTTGDELATVMSSISEALARALVDFGVPQKSALEIIQVTILQAGLFRIWADEIEEDE